MFNSPIRVLAVAQLGLEFTSVDMPERITRCWGHSGNVYKFNAPYTRPSPQVLQLRLWIFKKTWQIVIKNPNLAYCGTDTPNFYVWGYVSYISVIFKLYLSH